MKKLNNKGFTVVELVLSFVFVFTMAFAMFQLLFNYRTRQNEESIKAQLVDYTNQVTLAIQTDINERTLKNIDYCTVSGTVVDRCIVLNFNDGTSKQLAVEAGTKEYDGETYDINYIVYGNIIYESPDAILLNFKADYMLYNTYETDDIEDENVKVYKISIPIYHNDLEGNYGISIVAVAHEYENIIPMIRETSSEDLTAFWRYRDKIKNITLENSINIPSDAVESWDVSEARNEKVVAYIKTNPSNSEYYDLWIQGDGKIYANPNSQSLFDNFTNVDSIKNMDVLDTSKAVNMSRMFYYTGYNSTKFTLDLGNNFDTSNVTNMYRMFDRTGYSSPVFTLDLGDKFDTSKVTNMRIMFQGVGYNSTVFTLDLGDKFDTSNVTDMGYMFNSIGYSNPVFTFDLGDKFDTSKVTNMSTMFQCTGYSSTVFTFDLGDKFDTSNVTDMGLMFNKTGYSSPVFTLDLGDKFDTSKVTNMQAMFQCTGYSSTVFTLDLGDMFDTSKVTDMGYMFNKIGYSNPTFTLDLGDKFDTSKVTNMTTMFQSTGYSSTVFTLDLGNKFDTSNVADMSYMFYKTGYSSSIFKVDCSNWNVDKVESHVEFNTGVTSKVIPPVSW